MGRRVAVPQFQNHLRAGRVARGLSQGRLSQSSGLSRQAISAIESGRYVPNTTVALRLAQTLGCHVEEIFVLPQAVRERPAQLVGEPVAGEERLAVARVNDRLVAHPLVRARAFQDGFTPANGLATKKAGQVRLLIPDEQVERTALLLGCDPSLKILTTHVERHTADVRLTWLQASSQAALDAIAAGEAHIAGSHLPDRAGGDFNVAQARQALANSGGLMVTYANWEQGFIVSPGNPKRLRAVTDLARPDVQLVNREAGSGSRALLDELLSRSSMPPFAISGYSDRTVTSHLAVARTVGSGAADVGIGLCAVAQACGLDFVPLAEVRFDFVIPREHLEHPTVAVLLEVLQSQALRAELATLPGYSVGRMGTALELPAAA